MKKHTLSVFLRFGICIALFMGLYGTSAAQSYDIQAYELLKTNPEAFRAQLIAQPEKIINFKGADLRGVDLSRMLLVGADLSYARLEGVSLKEANLCNANFIGAKLMGTDFHRANLTAANFNKANATNAIFKDAILKNTITDYLMTQDGYQLNPAYISNDGEVLQIAK